MNLAADGQAAGGVLATRDASAVLHKPAAARGPVRHAAASEGGRFSDHLKAGDAADDRQAETHADTATATQAPRGDDPAADDQGDATAAAAMPGLVGTLLQALLAMPPRDDPAPPDAAAATMQVDAPAASAAAGSAAGASAEAVPAALKTDPAGTPAASAAQADVTALAAARDAAPDAVLALLNLPAAALAGTDRAAALATAAAPSQLPTHGELAEPLAERIVWMTDTARAHGGPGAQEARISLHPAELGSLQIRVETNQDGSTRVSFDVQTLQARQAIEASLPQLRELLATATTASGAASFLFSGGGGGDHRAPLPSWVSRTPSVAASDDDSAGDAGLGARLIRGPRGLVDHFA